MAIVFPGGRGAAGHLRPRHRTAPPGSGAKLVVVGAPGAGKSTLIGAVSDLPSVAEDARGASARATTVAMDFGRVTVDGGVVYLFGTPGHARFRFMWDRLADGAKGAVLVTDPARPAAGASARRFLADRGLPYVVVVNRVDGAPAPAPGHVRRALALPPAARVLHCDARRRRAGLRAIAQTMAHLRSRPRTAPASTALRTPVHLCGHPLTPPTPREHP